MGPPKEEKTTIREDNTVTPSSSQDRGSFSGGQAQVMWPLSGQEVPEMVLLTFQATGMLGKKKHFQQPLSISR